jgi:hypothetical protein
LIEATSDRERRAAIAERLARVRGALTDAEFAQLVIDVARTAERCDQIVAQGRDAMRVTHYRGVPDPLKNRPARA